MGKSVRELTTGEPGMSAHELCIDWPCYFATEHEIQEVLRKRAER